MEGLEDVPDSTDWLGTKLSSLSALEGELRCQVCKDFFNIPMITNCSHTFCALCIRRCLAAEGKCPACRSQEQEVRLRRNDTVASLVDIFQRARPSILAVAKEPSLDSLGRSGQRKRKADDLEQNGDPKRLVEDISYRTRSRSGMRHQEKAQRYDDSSSDIADVEELESSIGLVPCPVCHKKMKEELVYSHLDHCGNEKALAASRKLFSPSKRKGPEAQSTESSSRQISTERLPRLNFSLMKEVSLRKKLSEVGIPNSGSKAAMMKRYDEWVNLVNSNADSLKPQSTRQLLSRLNAWERSQATTSNGISKQKDSELVMDKAFDHQAWSSRHNSDFQDLISKARNAAISKKTGASTKSEDTEYAEAGIDHRQGQEARPANIIENIPPSDMIINHPESPTPGT